MYKVDVTQHLNEIISFYDEETDKQEIYKLFKNIVFKLEKNLYHLNNIKALVDETNENSDFYDLMPIYFEVESLFVSLRSTVDMHLHLINFCLDLRIPSREVYLNRIYRSPIPKILKDTFNRYTRKKNNMIWNFIYGFRNEIVHENSVIQQIPLTIKVIEGTPYLFTVLKKQERELQDLFKECIKFLDRFAEQVLSSLSHNLKNQA